jgi:hypothetical protein
MKKINDTTVTAKKLFPSTAMKMTISTFSNILSGAGCRVAYGDVLAAARPLIRAGLCAGRKTVR